MNFLSIKNIQKTYSNGVRCMDNISLELTNGMFGLLGPNGAGKSSLMRTITGLQRPDDGEIEFNGINIIKEPMFIRKSLGYLPQEFGVYPKISAYILLNHLAVLKGVVNKAERKEQILSLLNQTNLFEHRNKAVSSFSGGMRQRFGIAQALLGDPEIIILDEPTAGLDPEERYRFTNLLSEIGEHRIVILSTHIVEDVMDLCTNMAIIANGKVITQGNPSDLINGLEGMIWTKTVLKDQFGFYKKDFTVISSRLVGGKLHIHIYSPTKPGDGFTQTPPDLVDFYFYNLYVNL